MDFPYKGRGREIVHRAVGKFQNNIPPIDNNLKVFSVYYYSYNLTTQLHAHYLTIQRCEK